jgi:hypothetical protein
LGLWPRKLQRRAAEDALKVQLALRKKEGKYGENVAQRSLHFRIQGWLDKLNSNRESNGESNTDPSDLGTRLSHAALMLLKAP